MIPSLTNVPILGYIATDEDGLEDFKAHEQKLIIENNEFHIKYIGHAWGMIPADNNAHFELRYGEDGVEREYLVAEGLLWKKFAEVEEIFSRDSGFKSQSMDLYPPSVKGYVNEEGLYVFTSAKFEGLTILGEHVTPAMITSTIETFSVTNNIKAEFGEMLNEFNIQFSKAQEKGDDTVKTDKNPVLEPVTPVVPVTPETPETFDAPLEPVVDKTPEETPEPETNFAEPETPEVPATEPEVPAEPETDFADKKDKKDTKDAKDEDDEDEEEDEDEKDKKKKFFSVTFELSHDDIRTSLYSALSTNKILGEGYAWVSKVFENHAIVEFEDENYEKGSKFYKVNYVKHENAVSLGDHEELFPIFVNATEKSAIDSTRNNFEALETEVEELRTFKATAEIAEKAEKLTSYASALTKEEYKTIEDNLSQFSLVEIEKEIGFMLLKKNHFSANNVTAEVPSRVSAVQSEDTFQYGTASKYFTK